MGSLLSRFIMIITGRLFYLTLSLMICLSSCLYVPTELGGINSKMRPKRYEMNERGFASDSLTGGFGDFYTMKRSLRRPEEVIEKKLDFIIQALMAENH